MELWIARNKDGGLYLYLNKPVKHDYHFTCGYVYDDYIELKRGEFSEVTFENSPCKVKLDLVKGNSQNVYIVMRQEEHSDYVEKVFVDKDKAEEYCKQFDDASDEYSRCIEKSELVDANNKTVDNQNFLFERVMGLEDTK